MALALAPREYPGPSPDPDDWLAVPDLVDIWRQAERKQASRRRPDPPRARR